MNQIRCFPENKLMQLSWAYILKQQGTTTDVFSELRSQQIASWKFSVLHCDSLEPPTLYFTLTGTPKHPQLTTLKKAGHSFPTWSQDTELTLKLRAVLNSWHVFFFPSNSSQLNGCVKTGRQTCVGTCIIVYLSTLWAWIFTFTERKDKMVIRYHCNLWG